MKKEWIKASELEAMLNIALQDFTDEDWYRINARANEKIANIAQIASHEKIVIDASGNLLEGFTALFRGIQLNANVLVHRK
jgi:hypothetical protein